MDKRTEKEVGEDQRGKQEAKTKEGMKEVGGGEEEEDEEEEEEEEEK